MTSRAESSTTYAQTWTKENRLETITGNGQSVQYFYDGDGNRVKKVQNGQTTVYIGAIYEKNLNTSEVTTYYFAGGQRVAMRKGSTLSWFVTDHLGSTSLTLDASGNKIGEMKYYPFGETRSGSAPTDRRFTGQRQEDSSLGSLYDFNARFFSPALGRFLSADTMVPDGKNPQAFNRYAYTLNNPVKYNDPTGHDVGCPGKDAGQCSKGPQHNTTQLGSTTANTINPPPEEVPSTYPWEWITPKEPEDLTRWASNYDLYLACDNGGLECTTRTSYVLTGGQASYYEDALEDLDNSNPLEAWATSGLETLLHGLPVGPILETVEYFGTTPGYWGDKVGDSQRSRMQELGNGYTQSPPMTVSFETKFYTLVPDMGGGSLWVIASDSAVWINERPFVVPNSHATTMEKVLKDLIP